MFEFRAINDNPGVAKVENMRGNDQNNAEREQNQLIIMPILLSEQKKDSAGKQQKGHRTFVMDFKPMPQGNDSYQERKSNHTGFKPEIVYDIHAKNG